MAVKAPRCRVAADVAIRADQNQFAHAFRRWHRPGTGLPHLEEDSEGPSNLACTLGAPDQSARSAVMANCVILLQWTAATTVGSETHSTRS
jgi:hypothetical protein